MKSNKPSMNSLIFGIFIMGTGLFFFGPTLFTQKSALIEKNGIIENVEIVYQTVYYRGSSSIKSQLILNLKRDTNTYAIFENIGNNSINKRYENIRKELIKLRKVKILIKRNDNRFPTVFEISKETGEPLYSIKEAKAHSKFGFLITMFLGLILIGGYFFKRYYTIKIDPYYLDLFNNLKLILLRLAGPILALFFGILFILSMKSDQPLNFLTLIFGGLTLMLTYGSIMFEKSLKK